MPDLPEIDSRESLEAWLNTRPAEDATIIAHRDAMRVAPLWFSTMSKGWFRRDAYLAIPVLQLNLTLGLKCKYSDLEDKYRAAKVSAESASVVLTEAYYAEADTADRDHVSAVEVEMSAASAAYTAATGTAYATYRPMAAELWHAIGGDTHAIITGIDVSSLPLWPGDNPLLEAWQASQPILRDTPGGEFWIVWYQRTLDGRPQNWPLLRDVALIDDALWEEGGPKLDTEIRRLVEKHEDTARTALSRASPVEFDFDQILQHMQIVGFAEDLAHLRDPAVVASFIADSDELRDGLQDFLDFAADLAPLSNQPMRSVTVARKLLEELAGCRDVQSVRARRLITLGKMLADMALDDAERERLGPGLTNHLDDTVSLARSVYRKHLAPPLERMRPLMSLELGDNDPDALLSAAEHLAEVMGKADNRQLARLSPEAQAVIEDFMDELRQYRGAMAEASSPERRNALDKRFAEKFGGIAVAFGRYVEQGRKWTGDAVDWVIKQYKRWQTLDQIVETMKDCDCLPPIS